MEIIIAGSDKEKQQLNIGSNETKTIIVGNLENEVINVGENSQLTYILLAKNGWEDLKKMEFNFIGKGSELKFYAFIIGRGKDKFAFETVSNHKTTNTKAHFYAKAAMFDASQVDYKGTLIIKKEGQMSDVYLAHNTLLLSEKSRARTIPALEIEADDVKAGHAATVGKVDKELMFYLKSRGIEEKEAENILIHGFFEDLIKMIEDEKVQEQVRDFCLNSLPKHD